MSTWRQWVGRKNLPPLNEAGRQIQLAMENPNMGIHVARIHAEVVLDNKN